MTSRARFWLIFLSFILVAVVYLGLSGLTWTDIQHIGTPRNALEINGEDFKIPLPEPGMERIKPAVAVTTVGTYDFMMKDEEGDPVLWDPCRPISYVINPAGAPPGGEPIILSAIDGISTATGLAFEFEGYTSEIASFDRALIQPEVYGERFVPLIIGWSNATVVPELTGTVTGLGGSSSVPGAFGDQRYLVGGVVILDAEDIGSFIATGVGLDLVLAVTMHELGHVVGLGHIEDPTELMNPSNTSLTTWGPGDLAGLATAGSGPCQKD